MSEDASTYKIAERSCFVKIRYMVKIPNGPVLKGGTERELMDFVTGYRQVVPGLEQRLLGHSVGEKLAFTA
jgi:FKBP-type peptidyl-prolyl cis-trans isomerase 2